MDLFYPANLSPQPGAMIECPLPYRLSWAELGTALPGYHDPLARGGHAFRSHEKQGLNGGDNSCILTLRYPAERGETRSETVFVKCIENPIQKESARYRFLAGAGIATPRLLGAFQRGAGEVIVLEFVPEIGIDFHRPEEVDALLRLIAEWNAVEALLEVFPSMPGMPQDQFDDLVRGALAAMAKNPALPPVDPEGWFAAYKQASALEETMPRALCHNELFFQQMGWVQDQNGRKLVIFDLETMSPAPRFFDISGILFPLAQYTGRSQEDLFAVYLDRLRALGKYEGSFADALREMRLMRIVDMIESLDWFVSEGMEYSLRMAALCLREDING